MPQLRPATPEEEEQYRKLEERAKRAAETPRLTPMSQAQINALQDIQLQSAPESARRAIEASRRMSRDRQAFSRLSGVGGVSREPEPVGVADNKLLEAVLERGIDIGTGVKDARLRAGAQFAANDIYAINFFKQNGIEAKVDPEIGLIVKNPETNVWNPIDEYGISGDDFLIDPLNEIVQYGPEATLGTAGAVIGGPTLIGGGTAATMGTAGGAALGENLRHAAANLLGVPEPENIAQRATKASKVAALWGAASELTLGTALAIKAFFNPKLIAFDPATMKQAMETEEWRSAEALQTEINTTLEAAGRAERLQLTPGQMSDDVDVLDRETELLRSAYRNKLKRRYKDNNTAMEAYLDVVNPTPTDTALRTAAEAANEAGEEVIDVVRRYRQAEVDLAEQNIQEAINRGQYLMANSFDLYDESSLGRIVREEGPDASQASLGRARQAMKRLENRYYARARKAYGYNRTTASSDIKLNWDGNFTDVLNRLNAETKSALFPGEVTAKKQLTKRFKEDGDRIIIVDGNGEVVAQLITGQPIDLDAAVRGLQHLRRLSRQKQAGVVATDPTGFDINDLEKALNNMVKKGLQYQANQGNTQAGRALVALTNAEYMAKVRARTFDKGFVGQLLKNGPDGQLMLSNAEAYRHLFMSSDRDALEEVYNIAARNPRALKEMKRLIFATYRKEVAPDGVPDLALHKKFMNNHGQLIDTFFPQNANRLKAELGAFPDAINDAEKALQQLELQINKVTKNRIVRVDRVGADKQPVVTQAMTPGKLTDVLLNGRLTAGEVTDVVRILNRTGNRAVLQAWKEGVGHRIEGQLISGGGPALSVTKIDRILKQHEPVGALFGRDYINNLERLKQALIRSRRRTGDVPGNTMGQMISTWSRAVFRPLSRKGLVRTAVLATRSQAAHREMAEIVTDPKKLEAFLKLRWHKPGTTRTINIVGAIGAVHSYGLDEELQNYEQEGQ